MWDDPGLIAATIGDFAAQAAAAAAPAPGATPEREATPSAT
jgi:hypothetical protein